VKEIEKTKKLYCVNKSVVSYSNNRVQSE